MPIFNFYALENRASEAENDIFSDSGGAATTGAETMTTTPIECLGNLFVTHHSQRLSVLKTQGRGEKRTSYWDVHCCDVLRHEDGIILMTVEANRNKHTIVNKKDVEHEHHPYSMVMIDNRPGHQTVAIERGAAFAPDALALILQEGLCHLLHESGRKVELRRLKKTSREFWPVVEHLCGTYGDRVKQIRLDMNGRKEPPGGRRRDSHHLLGVLMELARKTQSEASLILANAEEEVKLKEVYEDVSMVAAICLKEKDYDLSVKFEQFGVYRYGAELLAQFGLGEKLIGQFENGELEFDDMGEPRYALTNWLNKVTKLLKDYGETNIPKPRTAARRRKVS